MKIVLASRISRVSSSGTYFTFFESAAFFFRAGFFKDSWTSGLPFLSISSSLVDSIASPSLSAASDSLNASGLNFAFAI